MSAVAAVSLIFWSSAVAEAAPAASTSDLPHLGDVPKVRAKRIEVHFHTPDPESVQGVDLWFTYDAGKRWMPYDFDPQPRRSPVTFIAPREGLCGLFLILRNEAGASAPPPTSGTKPQQWAFIDWTPPLVQIHIARKDLTFEQSRRVALKWTAYDKHLSNRPVDLFYMIKGQAAWRPIDLHLPNVQRYDWRVPEQVGGEVLVKLVVTDRCGNVVQRFSEPIEIAPSVRPVEIRMPEPSPIPIQTSAMANQPLNLDALADPPGSIFDDKGATQQEARAESVTGEARQGPTPTGKKSQPQPDPRKAAPRAETPSDARLARLDTRGRPPTDVPKHPTTIAAAVVSAEDSSTDRQPAEAAKEPYPKIDAERAQKLYQAATYYRLRGLHGHPADLALAILRFREALQADPTHTNARLDLAGVLLLQRKSDEAGDVYAQLLAHQPAHRDALQGLALTQVRTRQYDTAKKTLMRLVGLYPDDAEAWLNLGDVCMTTGDLASARQYWSRAITAQPDAADLIQKARLRLRNHQALPLARPRQ